MKNINKTLAAIALISSLATLGCANNGSPTIKVPSDINVNVDGSVTSEITVRHEITISVEMEGAFEDECVKDLPNGTPEELESCKNAKILDYTEKFMELLNQVNK